MRVARVIALALGSLAVPWALAAPIDWNTWQSNSSGTMQSDAGEISVTFTTANFHQWVASYPSWSPAATFADGIVVDNAPLAANGIMQLTGGSDAVTTLVFSRPVVNPVISIWSLGQPGTAASFVFADTPVLVAGGPNAEYGGQSLTLSGNTVTGFEGNGTVQFLGVYTQLSWTNPVFEDWYGFNVGVAGVVPEPGAWLLLPIGMAAISLARRRADRQGA